MRQTALDQSQNKGALQQVSDLSLLLTPQLDGITAGEMSLLR